MYIYVIFLIHFKWLHSIIKQQESSSCAMWISVDTLPIVKSQILGLVRQLKHCRYILGVNDTDPECDQFIDSTILVLTVNNLKAASWGCENKMNWCPLKITFSPQFLSFKMSIRNGSGMMVVTDQLCKIVCTDTICRICQTSPAVSSRNRMSEVCKATLRRFDNRCCRLMKWKWKWRDVWREIGAAFDVAASGRKNFTEYQQILEAN